MTRRILLLIFLVVATASCRTGGGTAPARAPQPAGSPAPIVMPGAPGQPTQVITADKATDLSQVQFVGADIKFMQGMIGHHEQALEMVALVPTHSASDGLKKLATRIDISQADEIKMMQGWLQARGQQVPNPNAMHGHGAMLMPGMLTPDEMDHLAAARGPAFDRLFLEGMIKHHGGALTMVEQLFNEPGAGQDSEIFAFASDVDADQRMEIERMSAMLSMIKDRQN